MEILPGEFLDKLKCFNFFILAHQNSQLRNESNKKMHVNEQELMYIWHIELKIEVKSFGN